MRIEILPGTHIRDAIDQALTTARDAGETVTFDFNGVEHVVYPDDTVGDARGRAGEARGAPALSREDEAEKARAETERMKREWADAIEAAGVMDEAAMREADVPWIEDADELAAYIAGLVDRPHDYGTCVYAMSMAAVAAYYHVAKRLGVTGFQAGGAQLDILKRLRGMEHGFRVTDYGDLLYPQYWSAEHFPSPEDLMNDPDVRTRIQGEARKLLEGRNGAHDRVVAHWQRLADWPTDHE